MAKSVTIAEGGRPVSLAGVSKLLIPEQGGLYSTWVPKDDRPVKQVYITENGTHLASDELAHGLSPIVVNVAGGNDWTDSSGTVIHPPIGGAGCSLIGTDPETGRVAQMTVAPNGNIEQKPRESIRVEPSSACTKIAKVRGSRTLYGTAPAKRVGPDQYGQSAMTNEAASHITIDCCAIYQGTQDCLLYKTTLGGSMDYGGDEEGESDFNAYRFDNHTYPADTETIILSADDERQRVREALVTISISYPDFRNPAQILRYRYDYLADQYADTRFMGQILGAHYLHWEYRGKDNKAAIIPYTDHESPYCLVNLAELPYTDASIARSVLRLGLAFPGKEVKRNDGSERKVRFFTSPAILLDQVEYCGPISEAPESAFILD